MLPAGHVVRELHEIKGEISLPPRLAPVANEDWEEIAVLRSAISVRFPLIPDGSANREGKERKDHAVEEGTRGLEVFRADRFLRQLQETVISLDRIPPGSGKGNGGMPRAIRTGDLHEFRGSRHASRVFVAMDAHRDHIPARLDEFSWHRVSPQVRPRIGALCHSDAADLLVVEISRIALVGGADGKLQVTPGPRLGNFNGFAEPHNAAVIQAPALPGSGQIHVRPRPGRLLEPRPAFGIFRVSLVTRLFFEGVEILLPILATFRHVGQITLEDLHDPSRDGVFQKRIPWRPGFRRRSTPRGVNEADGEIQTALELSGEIVGDR